MHLRYTLALISFREILGIIRLVHNFNNPFPIYFEYFYVGKLRMLLFFIEVLKLIYIMVMCMGQKMIALGIKIVAQSFIQRFSLTYK